MLGFYKNGRINELVFFMLLLFLAMLPKLYFMVDRITDPYVVTNYVLVRMSELEGHIVARPYPVLAMTNEITSLWGQTNFLSDRIGVTAILLSLRLVTGLSYDALMFLPIGGLLMFLGSYILARRITSSKLLIACFVIFISYDPLLTYLSYNTGRFAWTYFLFFVFLYLLYSEISAHSFKKIFSIILVISSISLMYYTLEGFLILFLLSFTLLLFVNSGVSPKKIRNKTPMFSILGVSLIYLAGFLYFDPLFDFILGSLSKGENFMGMLTGGVFKTINFPLISQSLVPYTLPLNPMVRNINTLVYLVIIIPSIVLISSDFFNLFKHKRRLSTDTIVSTSLFFVTSVLFIGVYFINHPLKFELVLLVFPLIYIIFVKRKIRNRHIRLILVFILISTVVIKMSLNVSEPIYNAKKFDSKFNPGLSWAGTNIYSNGKVLTNIVIATRLQMENSQLMIQPYWYKSPIQFINDSFFLYSNTSQGVEQFFEKYDYDYYILSDIDTDDVVIAPVIGLLKPSPDSKIFLDLSKNLDLVYSDSHIFVYRIKKAGGILET